MRLEDLLKSLSLSKCRNKRSTCRGRGFAGFPPLPGSEVRPHRQPWPDASRSTWRWRRTSRREQNWTNRPKFVVLSHKHCQRHWLSLESVVNQQLHAKRIQKDPKGSKRVVSNNSFRQTECDGMYSNSSSSLNKALDFASKSSSTCELNGITGKMLNISYWCPQKINKNCFQDVTHDIYLYLCSRLPPYAPKPVIISWEEQPNPRFCLSSVIGCLCSIIIYVSSHQQIIASRTRSVQCKVFFGKTKGYRFLLTSHSNLSVSSLDFPCLKWWQIASLQIALDYFVIGKLLATKISWGKWICPYCSLAPF